MPPTPVLLAVQAPPSGKAGEGGGEVPTYDHHYINGEWVTSLEPGRHTEVSDSNTGQVCARVPNSTPGDADRAVAAARAAFSDWSGRPLQERKAAVQRILEKWQGKRELAVQWLQRELGCPEKFARDVQTRMMDVHFSTALEEVDSVCFEERTERGALILKEPVGVVCCVTSWNYPLNQIAAKICPAMLVGCTVVLKPSANTAMTAYLVAEAVHEAGLPPGVFNMLQGRGPVSGQRLAGHPDVDLMSFTGSTGAGQKLLQAAANSNLKPVRMQLGGKGAALLLHDADFEQVVPQFVRQLMANSGQNSSALSRMVVPRTCYHKVVQLAKEAAEHQKVGRADDPDTTMGPLASLNAWQRVQGYIQKGLDEGARLVTGGLGKPEGAGGGFFAKPTIFAEVDNKMAIAQEDIFGPVLCIIPYAAEEDGIEIANDTIYGLNNAVASKDTERALRVARRLQSGTVTVNGVDFDNLGQGAADAPFGGYKQSGNAREWGKFGLQEFLQTKTVVEKCLHGGAS